MDKPDDHDHLDAWGRMRRDAIRDYGRSASASIQAGGAWNKFKGFMAGVAESAAELAPHSKWGVALDVAAIAAAPAVAGLEALRAGRAVLQGAKAAHGALEVVHLGKSIGESARVVAANAKPVAREVKNLLTPVRVGGRPGGQGPASAPVVTPLGPTSRPIKLPPITIKARGTSGHSTKQGALVNLAHPASLAHMTIRTAPTARPVSPVKAPSLALRPGLGGLQMRHTTIRPAAPARTALQTSAAARMRIQTAPPAPLRPAPRPMSPVRSFRPGPVRR